MKIISDMNIGSEKLEDVNDIGEEDDVLLNGDIANKEKQGNHFGTFLMVIKIMMKATLITTTLTKRALTMTWKGVEPFRITTNSYLMTIAFLRIVWTIKILMTVTSIMGVIVNMVMRVTII